MKKILMTIAIAISSSNMAAMAQPLPDGCAMLYMDGHTSIFETQNHQKITLAFNPANGDGISGDFDAFINQQYRSAALYDSHCNQENVNIKWNNNNSNEADRFSGEIQAHFDTNTHKLTNVSGNINDIPISDDFDFIGYK